MKIHNRMPGMSHPLLTPSIATRWVPCSGLRPSPAGQKSTMGFGRIPLDPSSRLCHEGSKTGVTNTPGTFSIPFSFCFLKLFNQKKESDRPAQFVFFLPIRNPWSEATTSPVTLKPACASGWAAASMVAPVVKTSSIRTMCRFSIGF